MTNQPGHAGRVLAESSPAFRESQRPPRGAPNVVVVVLDDLGFADFGCYGSAIETPHIDALAAEGLRFNNFHVTAVCAPTRACLLTGRNHHAVGMGSLSDFPMGFPGYNSRIPKSAGTLPRLLRDTGYNTFAVGKWHLTPRFERGAAGPFDRWPLCMGFERYYGFLGGGTNQWVPDLTRDNGFVEPPSSPDEGYHLTEDLASQAIRFVQDQQQAAPGKPFFLYFATGAMHNPHQVPAAWVEPYRNRFNDGWEIARDRAFCKQRQLGVIPPDTVLTDRPSWVVAWNDLAADERRLYARQMEVYAGFLTHTDAQVGRLMDFLATLGVLDNTLVMVVSDNGASSEAGPHGMFDMGTRDVETMLSRLDEFGGLRAWSQYSWGWAWAGNTPFKLWKRYSWLGGVRVPLIVHWPAGIAADSNNEIRPQFCHAIDLMPTILEATGIDSPEVVDGIPQQPLDGRSILPAFDAHNAPSPRVTQYFETLGSRALYHDGWKATTNHVDTTQDFERELIPGSHDFDTDQWSLFDLTTDFAEAHDLADAQPGRLRHMIELWWHEAGRNQVLPLISGQALGDQSAERTAVLEPPPFPDRRRYMYRPGGSPIHTPPPFLAGFHLTADVKIPDYQDVSGIICAHHNWAHGVTAPGGWACYLVNGHLTVTFNPRGVPTQIVTKEAVKAGRHKMEVTLACQAGTERDASIRVEINGREVGAGSIASSQLPPYVHGKLLIGHDHDLPVSDDYRPPFPFTGEIYSVIFDFTPPSDLSPSMKRWNLAEQAKDALRND